jgi:hypothetical protein
VVRYLWVRGPRGHRCLRNGRSAGRVCTSRVARQDLTVLIQNPPLHSLDERPQQEVDKTAGLRFACGRVEFQQFIKPGDGPFVESHRDYRTCKGAPLPPTEDDFDTVASEQGVTTVDSPNC